MSITVVQTSQTFILTFTMLCDFMISLEATKQPLMDVLCVLISH